MRYQIVEKLGEGGRVMRGSAGRALVVLMVLLALACSPQTHVVSRVIDGDTILLADGTKIRYLGIDTPEWAREGRDTEFMAREATDFNRELVEGRVVRLEYDVARLDRFGRTLAYVYLDTLFVNAELVRRGYAKVLTIPPNVKHAETLKRLQREAREERRGLWGRR